MNPNLIETIIELQMTEVDAMNLLQNSGTISDLCVIAADVATGDVSSAIKYLKMSHGVLI